MFTFKCPMIRYLCVSSVVLISYKTTRKVYTVYGLFILKLIKPNHTKRLYIKHESIQSNKIKKSSIELSKVYSGFSAISLYIPHNTMCVLCTLEASTSDFRKEKALWRMFTKYVILMRFLQNATYLITYRHVMYINTKM